MSEDTPATPQPVRRQVMEDKIPKGLAIRVFVYVVAGHLFAFFVYLLFTVGAGR